MLNKAVSDFISMLFPRLCAGCGRNILADEGCICTHCRLDLLRSNKHFETDNHLLRKFGGRVHLKYAFSYLKYTKRGIVFRLLQSLKYEGSSEIGITLGKMFGSELASNGYSDAFDLLIPVPLHRLRQQKRGYNQSEMFADGLAGFVNAEVAGELVIRTKATKTQTKFSLEKRWDNVKDIFRVTDPDRIKDKRIAIIDDVLTTGATLESLANEILKYNPLEISILILAEADRD